MGLGAAGLRLAAAGNFVWKRRKNAVGGGGGYVFLLQMYETIEVKCHFCARNVLQVQQTIGVTLHIMCALAAKKRLLRLFAPHRNGDSG